jgi:hypothetical protein
MDTDLICGRLREGGEGNAEHSTEGGIMKNEDSGHSDERRLRSG